MKVYIDPRARISYASYYIEGLYFLFGKSVVKFKMEYFVDLVQTNGIEDFDQYFAFVIEEKFACKRIVIDYRDKNTINQNALKWSHIYGKVNYNEIAITTSCPDSQIHKIIPIGPNFGIKIWSNAQTFLYLFVNYFKCRNTLPVGFRAFLAGYNWQRKRPKFEQYRDSLSDENYIFFISTFYKESQNQITNQFRAAYIKACKNSNINFEGGLLSKRHPPEYNSYKEVITQSYIKSEDYLMKIRRSAVVFNTSAFWDCLGWKLGEFLAMGKAIISTPLKNDMPVALVHGENIHYVESEAEIESAVVQLINDKFYRQKLEFGAKTYFNKYLAPEIVIQRLVASLV